MVQGGFGSDGGIYTWHSFQVIHQIRRTVHHKIQRQRWVNNWQLFNSVCVGVVEELMSKWHLLLSLFIMSASVWFYIEHKKLYEDATSIAIYIYIYMYTYICICIYPNIHRRSVMALHQFHGLFLEVLNRKQAAIIKFKNLLKWHPAKCCVRVVPIHSTIFVIEKPLCQMLHISVYLPVRRRYNAVSYNTILNITMLWPSWNIALQWRHNGRDGVSNHQSHDCLLNRLFRRRSKKTFKLRVAGLCKGNSPVAGELPAQMANNAENVSI